MAGGDDPVASLESTYFMHQLIPHAELKIFDKSGHVIPAENTLAFLQELKRFLGVWESVLPPF